MSKQAPDNPFLSPLFGVVGLLLSTTAQTDGWRMPEYPCGVHSKLLAYKDSGIRLSVTCEHKRNKIITTRIYK